MSRSFGTRDLLLLKANHPSRRNQSPARPERSRRARSLRPGPDVSGFVGKPAPADERAHQGYRTQGCTPYQAFVEGIEAMSREEVKREAA